MSVIGIGTDIVEINRITAMSEKMRERLALRVLTGTEYKRYSTLKQPERYLAKRWAGKEALSKALGTGIAKGVSFQHIEIQSLTSGQPILQLTDKALEIAESLGANKWHITLSDEVHYATAFVVLCV
ncbi:holo-ACP synthase [Colwellia sp. UCD-KL20]|uniref:holo-ACP synthase n=1 Tax=Colwellia sp. UCD-KL20 TaxID=1917165 RepID=UPI000970C6BE|nr:holo-ACP synthase [Colwellia sp. UCD-KL20]